MFKGVNMAKKKNKKKKEKKVLGIPVNFNFGNKIKDISINLNKYKIANLIILILLNVSLIGVLIYYMTLIFNVFVLIISLFTAVICLAWSISSYLLSVVKIKYTIYENAIVKNYDTSQNVGDLSKLLGYKKKTTLLDRIGKINTSTLVLKFDNTWCSKIVMRCINEDIDEIVELITTLAHLKNSDTPKKQPKEKTLIQTIQTQLLKNAPPQSKISQEKEKK